MAISSSQQQTRVVMNTFFRTRSARTCLADAQVRPPLNYVSLETQTQRCEAGIQSFAQTENLNANEFVGEARGAISPSSVIQCCGIDNRKTTY